LSSRAEPWRAEPSWRAGDRWRAELVAVWAFALRNLQMATRNVFLLFELLFWPIVGVLTIGLMSRFLTLRPAETSFVLIGQMAFSIVGTCQLDVAYSVLYDFWSKSMKHQFLAPIGIRHLTLGSWAVGILRGLLVFSLTAALAWWAFRFNVFEAGVAPVAALLVGCFLTAWIVGVLVCVLIMLFGGRAETAAWASINLVLALAGIYYPVSVLPAPAAAVASAIPLTYFLDAYRSHFGFPPEYSHAVLTGLGLSALYVTISHWIFRRAVAHARRTGLLLKMSE
jgi:ABC-2 type transport system permease protein